MTPKKVNRRYRKTRAAYNKEAERDIARSRDEMQFESLQNQAESVEWDYKGIENTVTGEVNYDLHPPVNSPFAN